MVYCPSSMQSTCSPSKYGRTNLSEANRKMYVEQKKTKMQIKWFASLLKAELRPTSFFLPVLSVLIKMDTLTKSITLSAANPYDICKVIFFEYCCRSNRFSLSVPGSF